MSRDKNSYIYEDLSFLDEQLVEITRRDQATCCAVPGEAGTSTCTHSEEDRRLQQHLANGMPLNSNSDTKLEGTNAQNGYQRDRHYEIHEVPVAAQEATATFQQGKIPFQQAATAFYIHPGTAYTHENGSKTHHTASTEEHQFFNSQANNDNSNMEDLYEGEDGRETPESSSTAGARRPAGRKGQPRPKKWTVEEVALAMELKQAGHGADEIGQLLGRTGQAVQCKLWRNVEGHDPKAKEKRDKAGAAAASSSGPK